MYAKDMVSPELDARTLVLKFRVGKPLRHFIGEQEGCRSWITYGYVLDLWRGMWRGGREGKAANRFLPTRCKPDMLPTRSH